MVTGWMVSWLSDREALSQTLPWYGGSIMGSLRFAKEATPVESPCAGVYLHMTSRTFSGKPKEHASDAFLPITAVLLLSTVTCAGSKNEGKQPEKE